MLYVHKGSRQDIGAVIFDIPTVIDVTYDMDYLEIPVLLRYHWLIDRSVDIYSLAGFAFALKVDDRYQLTGDVSDGEESIPLRADSDMSEVDLFDFLFTYGLGLECPWAAGGCSWSTVSISACSSCPCPPMRTCPSATRPSASRTIPCRCATSATCCSSVSLLGGCPMLRQLVLVLTLCGGSTVASPAAAFTHWNDVRASALLPGGTVTIRTENARGPGLVNTILFAQNGVQEAPLSLVADGPSTLEATVPGPVTSRRYYGFRLIQPGALDLLPVGWPTASPRPALI